MTRSFLLLGSALAFLGACDRTPSEPTLEAAITKPAATRGNASRPVSGSCRTTWIVTGATYQPPPNDDQLATLSIVHTGTCLIAHLGKTSLTIPQTVYLDATGLHAIANDVRFTAANGDELHATDLTELVPPDADGNTSAVGVWTIQGGTGRFAAATGSITFTGHGSVITSSTESTLQGWIQY